MSQLLKVDINSPYSQRVSRLCGVLGKSEEQQRRILQGLVQSESTDLAALLSASQLTGSLEDETTTRQESDTESGFEDGGSLLSKSLLEDSGSMSGSAVVPGNTLDDLTVETLLAELKSVAVNWKSLRNIRTCSCATPFEHFTKKVGSLYTAAIGVIFSPNPHNRHPWYTVKLLV